jgi:hypothetical protein
MGSPAVSLGPDRRARPLRMPAQAVVLMTITKIRSAPQISSRAKFDTWSMLSPLDRNCIDRTASTTPMTRP